MLKDDVTRLYHCVIQQISNLGFSAQPLVYLSYFTSLSLFIAELLDTGPVISGGLIDYRIGDRLVLNCTSPKTYPPTRLKWLINGKEVSSSSQSLT